MDDLNCTDFFTRYCFVHLHSKCVDLFLRTFGWMVQTTTLCVNLALRQRQLLHFFHRQLEWNLSPHSCAYHYKSQNAKMFSSCLAIVWSKRFSLFSPSLFPIPSLIRYCRNKQTGDLMNEVAACKFHFSQQIL